MPVLLKDRVPNLKARYSAANPLPLEEIAAYADGPIAILCLKCRCYSSRAPRHILNKPNACSICSGKELRVGVNDALTAQPRLKEIWNTELNSSTPENYTRQHAAKVWINCSKCRQTNLRKVSDAVNSPFSCVVCSGKKAAPGKGLSSSRSLMKTWDPSNGLDPETIPLNSTLIAKWICDRGHRWTVAIVHRAKLGWGCPYCSGQRVLKGFNDLATTFPELAQQVSPRSKLSANEVSKSSWRELLWECPKCSIEFSLPVVQRYDAKTGRIRLCSKCSRKRISYGEVEVYEFVRAIRPDAILGARRVLSGAKELDIYVPSLKIAIEFNGDYWHSDKVLLPKLGVSAEAHHQKRKDECESLGILLAYVWNSDWTRHRAEVQQALAALLTDGDMGSILKTLTKG